MRKPRKTTADVETPAVPFAPPAHSMARNIGLLVLRAYLILVAVLVAVRFGQLIGGFGH